MEKITTLFVGAEDWKIFLAGEVVLFKITSGEQTLRHGEVVSVQLLTTFEVWHQAPKVFGKVLSCKGKPGWYTYKVQMGS